MSDEKKNTSLNDWGIDVDKFKERAKESLATAKGDLSEITGTLRETLLSAKDIVSGLQTGGAAAELKTGFERAWQEIESAFKNARDKARAAKEAAPTPEEPAAESTEVVEAPADSPAESTDESRTEN